MSAPLRGVACLTILVAAAGCNALNGLSSLEPVDCVGDCGGSGTGGGSTGGGPSGGAGGVGGGGGTIEEGGGPTLGPPAEYGSIVMGRHTSCVADLDAVNIWCWGEHTGSEAKPSSTRPVHLPELTASVVTLGFSHACARDGDMNLGCWGNNDHGQLGDGTRITRRTAVQVDGLVEARRSSSGAHHNCTMTDESPARIFCWGKNAHGQIGTGDTEDQLVPFEVPGFTDPIRVGCGADYSCAVEASGELYCWGLNDRGQLGLDPATNPVVLTPTLIPGLPALERVYPGNKHTCLRTQGTRLPYCWGSNDFGQLGDGGTTSRFTPELIDNIGEVGVLYTGNRHTCVHNGDQEVYCFGANEYGQLGTAKSPTPQTTPALVGTDIQFFNGKLSEHTCRVGLDGILVCSGLNDSGQLGTGTYESTDVLTPVLW